DEADAGVRDDEDYDQLEEEEAGEEAVEDAGGDDEEALADDEQQADEAQQDDEQEADEAQQDDGMEADDADDQEMAPAVENEVAGEDDEVQEQQEEDPGREEVATIPEPPAAAAGELRSEPRDIIEIEATPTPKRPTGVVARQDSYPKLDAPQPTRLQVLHSMLAKLKREQEARKAGIRVPCKGIMMDNVETQTYDADASAAALTDCMEIQDSDDAPEPLREVPPPAPVQEEDQLEFAPEARAEVKNILSEEDAKNFKEGSASSAPPFMCRHEASSKLQKYMEEAILLKANQDLEAAKNKEPEEEEQEPVTNKSKRGRGSGRGGRGRGRGGRGSKTHADSASAGSKDKPKSKGKGKGKKTKDREETTEVDEEKSGSEAASNSKDQPKSKGKGKGKKAKDREETSEADKDVSGSGAASSGKEQPKPKGKGRGKKAKDREERSTTDDAAHGSKRKAKATKAKDAGEACAEEGASKRRRKQLDRPPVPTFKHAELSVYWTRAGVGVKCKMGEDKGKQVLYVATSKVPIVAVIEAKLLDDAEACVTPPLLEAMNRIKTEFLAGVY
ncbi:unnamed protein product, partial [Symbiodinium sp. CCMP2592]